MMKRNILSLLLISLSILAYGQGELDLYKMSLTDLQGTARGQAMGGAFGALGGDMTGTIINPGGLAVYRSSEISGTLDVGNIKNDADWQGIKESESRWNVALNNVSLVYYSPIGNRLLKNINFGFSYHRLKHFNNKYKSAGSRMDRSLADYMVNTTNGYKVSDMGYSNSHKAPWLSTLGYDAYLFDDIDETTYQVYGLEEGQTVDPYLYVEEKGYVDAYDFSLGFNFNNRVYWGATFIITDIDYTISTYYTEEYELMTGQDRRYSFNLDNRLISEGSGYQLKTGLVWRPIDALRLGVSYHSPTWYSMTDYYKGWIDAYLEADYSSETPDDRRTYYQFHSPYSWTFSAAGIIGTKAIISLDYEIKDYTTMNLQDNDGRNIVAQNNAIDADYKVASTIRLGAEYKITPQLAIRAGYAWAESPYKANLKDDNIPPFLVGTIPHYVIEGATQHITAGIGYRFTPEFYVDLTFVHRSQSSDLYYFPSLYDYYVDEEIYVKTAQSTPAALKSYLNKGLLTLGYRF